MMLHLFLSELIVIICSNEVTMHKARRVCLPLALIVMVSTLAMAQIDGPAAFGRTTVGFSWGEQGLVPESSVAIDRAVWENLSEPVLFVADGNGPWNPGVVGVDQGAGAMRIGRLDGNPLPLSSVYDVIAIDGATVPNAFIHRATTGNIVSNWTLVDHPAANDNPDAVIVITPHTGPEAGHPAGVWYTGDRWAIYNEDRSPMAPGRRFSVLVIDPASPSPLADIVAADSIGLRQEMRPNGDQVHEYRLPYRRESMRLLATHNYRSRGPYNLSPLSVQFDGSSWMLSNTTMEPVPEDLIVNVVVFDPAPGRTTGSAYRASQSYYPPYRFVAGRDPALRSVRSAVSVSVTFGHQYSGMEAIVSWIDYNGQPVEYFRVAPQDSITFQTYETHIWFVELVGETSSLFFSFIADERPEQNVFLYVER
jgi:hypothetical protein